MADRARLPRAKDSTRLPIEPAQDDGNGRTKRARCRDPRRLPRAAEARFGGEWPRALAAAGLPLPTALLLEVSGRPTSAQRQGGPRRNAAQLDLVVNDVEDPRHLSHETPHEERARFSCRLEDHGSRDRYASSASVSRRARNTEA